MYLATAKDDHIVMCYGECTESVGRNAIRFVEEMTVLISSQIDIYMLEGVPEYVRPFKYTYTVKDGFRELEDPQSKNPWNLPEETVQGIKEEAIAEVQEGAKNG